MLLDIACGLELRQGYSGYEGMYVLAGSLETALNQSGVGLDFYRFYNVDFFAPARFGTVFVI